MCLFIDLSVRILKKSAAENHVFEESCNWRRKCNYFDGMPKLLILPLLTLDIVNALSFLPLLSSSTLLTCLGRRMSLIAFMLYISFYANTQALTVSDATTLQPLEGVKIRKLDNSFLFTNAAGQVETGVLKDGEQLVITLPLYQEQVVTKVELLASGYRAYLQEQAVSIDEIVVSASRFREKRKDVAQEIKVIRPTDLAHMNQSSMADVLSNQGNVFVQKSQLGGGSPIIRGFETNKVLLVVDGVRMNNAIYRGGHLQNVITLDNAIMERTEIVLGPGSVVYGSDALGGVMHFYTKNPAFSTGDTLLVKANISARYHSAASGYTGHADISAGNKKLASLTSFTYSHFGDLRQGARRNPFYGSFGSRNFYVERINGADSMLSNADSNLQVGSAYTQYDLLQKLVYKQSANVQHLLNVQYSTSSKIDRYDRLTQLSGGEARFAEWYYGPQNRFLASYTLGLSRRKILYDELKIILAYQNIEESRIDRRFKKDLRNHRLEEVGIISATIDAEKLIGKQELRYGAEFVNNTVSSVAHQEDINSGMTAPLDTRYPDGDAYMRSVAGYVTHTWEISPNFILNDGIRLSYVNLGARFEDKTFFPFPFSEVKQSNAALNGSLGCVWMPGETWRFTGLLSTGFRAPNVDDLAKVFESVQGAVVVPNPGLKPEYAYNAEIGLSRVFDKKITVSINGYYTLLRNAIAVLPATFEGNDSIVYDGEMSQVLSARNSAEAFVYGLEACLKGNISPSLSVYSTFNYTYGRLVTAEGTSPLDHIPPVFGRAGFNLSRHKFRSELFVQYSGWKYLKDYNLTGEDNIAYANKHGMPAWYTLNTRISYQFSKYFYLQAACENILDANYRQFASNISAPGRNFIFTARLTFQ